MEHIQPISASLSALEVVENIVRTHVYYSRQRVLEVFRDFDRLRTGRLTRPQFRRCVGKFLEKGPTVSDEQHEVLAQHYDPDNTGSIAYMPFVDSIERVFGEKNLEKAPTQAVSQPYDILMHPRAISPTSMHALMSILERMRQYVQHRGSDVKSWFRDYDSHNNGLITVNQFKRGFPPNLIEPDEMDLLIEVSTDETTQIVNYFKLNTAVNRKPTSRKGNKRTALVATPRSDEYAHPPIGIEALLESTMNAKSKLPVLLDVQRKLMKNVYKRRLRLLDFFKDYDKHNHGTIFERQFLAGLKLTQLPLSVDEILLLADNYKESDGRIDYRNFCNDIEQVFTGPDVEHDPTVEMNESMNDLLLDGPNILSPEKEEHCIELLRQLQAQVRKRRLNMMSFFKEFDKKSGSCGQITKSHFSRLLSLLNLEVSESEMYLLLDKYAETTSNLINYLNFIQAIDPEWSSSNTTLRDRPKSPSSSPHRSTPLGIGGVMDFIIYQVAIKGLRLSEVFKDYDRLRSGSVSRHDFIRALDLIGLSLSQEERELVADRYQDLVRPDKCCWRTLEKDVDVATGTVPNLELQPSLRPTGGTPYEHHPYSPVLQQRLSSSENYGLHQILDDFRVHFTFRQTNIKHPFYAFDKLRTGKVTRTQFRQILTELGLKVTDGEFRILCKQYIDAESKDPRFLYVPFVQELERSVEEDDELITQQSRALSPNIKTMKPPKVSVPDEKEQFIHRLKAKVKTERICVLDFLKDFDHHRRGRITKNEFRRALTNTPFQLNDAEFSVLQDMYAVTTPGQTENIEYRRFAEDMDSVFTMQQLEAHPTEEPKEFKPLWHEHHSDKIKAWSSQDEKELQGLMHEMAEALRRRRMFFVLRYLEDHDKIHKGTITRSQLRSTMDTVGITLRDDEANLIFRKYALEGYKDDIDYLRFNEDLTEMSKKVWKSEGMLRGKGDRGTTPKQPIV